MFTMSSDLVCVWDVIDSDAEHKVAFEHNTLTGRRVVQVDGVEVVRRGWMVDLEGSEHFAVGSNRCRIDIFSADALHYGYRMFVNGRSLASFTNNRCRTIVVWHPTVNGQQCRLVLDKDTMDVWLNGQRLAACERLFTDHGSDIHFDVFGQSAVISIESSGRAKRGIVYTLTIDRQRLLPEDQR